MKSPAILVSDETNLRQEEPFMSYYHHLTMSERESLMLFHEQGKSIREIARQLGRAPSTISRELRRNPQTYRATKAQIRYFANRTKCVRHAILDDLELHHLVHFLLGYLWWSPEQISFRLRAEGCSQISTSTIYRALDNGRLQDTLRYYLRIKYKKLGKNKEPRKVCFEKTIDLRPVEADIRAVPGHWEGDTVRGSNETDSVVTLVDRYSRFLLCQKVPNRESSTVRLAVVKLLTQARLPVKTVTFDQGTEFAENKAMEEGLEADVYYAHPRSPWERPTNENTNGLIRQFIPKRSKVSTLTEDDISRIVARLNFRPRKCLGWRTPYEVAFNQVLHFT